MFDFIFNNNNSYATPQSYRFDEEGYVTQLLTDGTYLRLFHPDTFEDELEFDMYGRTELEYLKDTDLNTYVKLIYDNGLEEYIRTIIHHKKDVETSFSKSLITKGYCSS